MFTSVSSGKSSCRGTTFARRENRAEVARRRRIFTGVLSRGLVRRGDLGSTRNSQKLWIGPAR